jgi:hypothetical protein
MTRLLIVLDKSTDVEQLGFIPDWLDPLDDRSAREQLDAGYIGGWHPMDGWKLADDGMTIKFRGDPPLSPIALMYVREELVCLYPASFVAVIQRDGSLEVARMD